VSTYNKMSDVTKHVGEAFKIQINQMITAELDKILKDEVPKMIARASELIEIDLVNTPAYNGIEVRFIIMDTRKDL
jgi:hypothetical protein